MKFNIEPYDPNVHTKDKCQDFSCEETALNDYFHKRMSQDAKRSLSKAFVLLEDGSGECFGFYTLSNHAIEIGQDELDEIKKRNSEHQNKIANNLLNIDYRAIMPSILIGRLARDIRLKGNDIGSKLLSHALLTILDIHSSGNGAAFYFIVVDAKNDVSKRFYEGAGFIPLSSNPYRLVLTIHHLKKTFEQ